MSLSMELHDVVMKLVGPIDPIGETYADERSFENLLTLTKLVDKLVADIDLVASANKDCRAYSKRRAGELADRFLTQLGISP